MPLYSIFIVFYITRSKYIYNAGAFKISTAEMHFCGMLNELRLLWTFKLVLIQDILQFYSLEI